MKKRTTQKWFRAYLKDKSGNYRPNPALKVNQPGVYFIKNTAGEIVYIGQSTYNVEKTLFRHFQEWNDRNHERKVYSAKHPYKVRIITTSAARATAVEKLLILQYRPKDNPMKYQTYKFSASEKAAITQAHNEQKSDFAGFDLNDNPF